jgi:hypothetical protein
MGFRTVPRTLVHTALCWGCCCCALLGCTRTFLRAAGLPTAPLTSLFSDFVLRRCPTPNSLTLALSWCCLSSCPGLLWSRFAPRHPNPRHSFIGHLSPHPSPLVPIPPHPLGLSTLDVYFSLSLNCSFRTRNSPGLWQSLLGSLPVSLHTITKC